MLSSAAMVARFSSGFTGLWLRVLHLLKQNSSMKADDWPFTHNAS